jgi:uncharacterized protein (DUF952 family)
VNATPVFKILSAADWTNALTRGNYSGSSDDKRDGFIHLSTAAQLAGTLAKHFSGQTCLVLVAFDSVSLAPLLKWEASRGGDLFPHYYGALPVSAALWQKQLPAASTGISDLYNFDTDVTQSSRLDFDKEKL